MSVSLLQGKEAAKIANSFTKEETQRNIWYAYISNVTAYNLQYIKNEQIDFKGWEANEDKYYNINEAIDALGGLIYNAYTNAGNYFCPLKSLEDLGNIVKDHRESTEYKQYEYELLESYR